MRPFSNNLKTTVYYRLPVIALCTAIFWQSSFPGVIAEPVFPFFDKVLHFSAYALMAILVVRCLIHEKKAFSPAAIRLTAIVFSSLFGLSDEIHQAFVPARDATIGDFAADLIGAVCGTVFYMRVIADRISHKKC